MPNQKAVDTRDAPAGSCAISLSRVLEVSAESSAPGQNIVAAQTRYAAGEAADLAETTQPEQPAHQLYTRLVSDASADSERTRTVSYQRPIR